MTYEFAEGYKIRNQAVTHFLTFTIVGWSDIFTRQHYRDIMLGRMQCAAEQIKDCRQAPM